MALRAITLFLTSALLITGCSYQDKSIRNHQPVAVQPKVDKIIPSKPVKTSPACPSVSRAAAWARKKGGVSFALICHNRVRGYKASLHSQSASTGKALMLLAFLRRNKGVAAAKPTLSRMIHVSDNEAAHQTYAMLGDEPLKEASRRAGLKSIKYCGCWSYISWSPADYARLFYSLPDSLPKSNRWWAMKTLRDIAPGQSWGIPAVAREKGYQVYFKGGWRPDPEGWIVLQGALLSHKGEKMSLAVFTRNQKGLESGIERIKTVTELLLD